MLSSTTLPHILCCCTEMVMSFIYNSLLWCGPMGPGGPSAINLAKVERLMQLLFSEVDTANYLCFCDH